MVDPIRNVFFDPDKGDVIELYRERLEVVEIERRPGKTVIRAQINGEHRYRYIDSRAWREYGSDGATVIRNASIADAFE